MWAYRERAYDIDCPIRKAELLQFSPKQRMKVRVRWLDGEFTGLDEWVPRVRLRFPWDERDEWLREERALDAVIDASEGVEGADWYEAANMLFRAAYPPRPGRTVQWGLWCNLAPRAGLEPTTHRLTADCSTIELPGSAAARAGGRRPGAW